MAKTKDELLDDATPEPEAGVGGDAPVDQGTHMYDVPQVAPDGHVHLSQEDIDARNGGS